MWVDQRGSEIVPRRECLRLLAMEAHAGGVGRIALSRPGAPVVQPVNFSFHEGDVLVRLGDGLLVETAPGSLVAFEVDAVDTAAGIGWSVLVRGLATVLDPAEVARLGTSAPRPMAPQPGDVVVAVRPDVVTGRRFPLAAAAERGAPAAGTGQG